MSPRRWPTTHGDRVAHATRRASATFRRRGRPPSVPWGHRPSSIVGDTGAPFTPESAHAISWTSPAGLCTATNCWKFPTARSCRSGSASITGTAFLLKQVADKGLTGSEGEVQPEETRRMAEVIHAGSEPERGDHGCDGDREADDGASNGRGGTSVTRFQRESRARARPRPGAAVARSTAASAERRTDPWYSTAPSGPVRADASRPSRDHDAQDRRKGDRDHAEEDREPVDPNADGWIEGPRQAHREQRREGDRSATAMAAPATATTTAGRAAAQTICERVIPTARRTGVSIAPSDVRRRGTVRAP